MKPQEIHEKADQVRDVLRYLNQFNQAIIVIHIDDDLIDSPVFSSHIRDIAMLHAAGLKVVIVPGSKKRIDTILQNENISWTTHNHVRIVPESALNLVKMATFDVSNTVMTHLAQEQLTAVIGNWVRARGLGVIDGIDYCTAGDIDKINLDSLETILEQKHIPIFPCIGWSGQGKPYNISSVRLSTEIASMLKAQKLFFLTAGKSVTADSFSVPSSVILTDDGSIPSLDLDEAAYVLQNTSESEVTEETMSLIRQCVAACQNGVDRAHIVNGQTNGSLLTEIFSDNGSGTMIYTSNYGGIRNMTAEDIPSVLSLMQPFVEKGNLLPRSRTQLLATWQDYIVYEVDGGIKACAALHHYESDDTQAEIAAVAVSEKFSSLGIGPKMINYLIDRARDQELSQVFILTTKTSDWFEQFGFVPADIDAIPVERKSHWTPERNSKVYILRF